MKTNGLKLANDLQVGDCWSLKTIVAREAQRRMKTRTCAKSTGSVAQAGRPTPGRSLTHRGAGDRQLSVEGQSPKHRAGRPSRPTDQVFWATDGLESCGF